MNLPFYIARRYLFSKKSTHAINIISAVSMAGVAVATMALVVTMSVFNGSIDDMIANMVKKMLTTKILQPWFEQQWATIQKSIDERGAKAAQDLAEWTDFYELAKQEHQRNPNGTSFSLGDGIQRTWAEAEEYIKRKIAEAENELAQSALNPDDIKRYAELLRSGKPVVEENMKDIEDFLRELGLLNDTKDKTLSALQQGIQGITEDTAGALEGYMNGVSQQVYLQSDLLTQIRDAVVTLDNDVTMATQAQMLLQLQNNYILMQTMASLMSGWTTPSGQGIRVELIN